MFLGILNIIGGCSWWQIWVYLLISLQQIPHAMFNLSVVYFLIQHIFLCFYLFDFVELFVMKV